MLDASTIRGGCDQGAEPGPLVLGGVGPRGESPTFCLAIAIGELEPVPVESLGVVEFLGGGEGPMQPVAEEQAGGFFGRLAELVGREPASAAVAGVGQAHHVVEALAAPARAPDAGVEQE